MIETEKEHSANIKLILRVVYLTVIAIVIFSILFFDISFK